MYDYLAPRVISIGADMAGTTVATLEFPSKPETRWGWGLPPHPGLAAAFAKDTDRYRKTVSGLERHLPHLRAIPRRPGPGGPCWENLYWTGIDAVLQYSAIQDRRPSIYLEIGSGYSTLFARRAVQDHGLGTTIVSIDPSPREDVDASCDSIQRCALEHADLSVFGDLRSGDMVLFDGTHTAFMGSDAVIFFLEVLPVLSPGVLVGIHDIFLPWDYPPQWVDRWYGEQYLAATLLLADTDTWRVLFPTWYVTNETDLCRDLDELWDVIGDPPGRTGSSLWIERV